MKEREFINPFTDFGFKRIFGQEINKDRFRFQTDIRSGNQQGSND